MTAKTYYQIHGQADKKFRDRLRGRKKKVFGALEQMIQLLMLDYHWSPEQISNRLKLCYPELENLHISHEGIYQYVYNSPARRFMTSALRTKRKKRGVKKHNGFQRGGIKNHVSIHKRSRAAADRSEAGHWESDLIIGKDCKGAIGTIVDRATRYTIMVPLESKHTRHVVDRFGVALSVLPSWLRKSITHDHGSEMTHHETLAAKSEILVYFADPGSPWQRPTNENTNGLIREFFPKGSDLTIVKEGEIERVQSLLNNRPRKCLGYRTPSEVLEERMREHEAPSF
jgi:IS30 family transposase